MPYDEPMPTDPSSEHEKMLLGRLEHATERIKDAERELKTWLPIRDSCQAGLQTFTASMNDDEAKAERAR